MDKDERTRKILDLIPETLDIDSEGINSTAIYDKLMELDRIAVALDLLRWADEYQLAQWGGQVEFKIGFDSSNDDRPYLEDDDMAYAYDLEEQLCTQAWNGIEKLIEIMDEDTEQIHRYQNFCRVMSHSNWNMSSLPQALEATLPSMVGNEPSHQWVGRQISLLQASKIQEHTPSQQASSRAGPRL